MSKKSDAHERKIAEHINTFDNVSAKRPVKGTDYSDVLVTYNGNVSWLEIKMNHQDNLANPRVYYHENAWKSRYTTPLAGYIVNELNKSQVSLDFVYSISDYCGMAYESIYIPTLRSQMNEANAIPKSLMRSYCKEFGAYVLDYKDHDLTDVVTSHYIHGKTEPAYYMQAGDDFFMISNTNPLGLSSDIPMLEGTGKLRVRVSNRSQFYEVQAEVKMMSLLESKYSVLPGTDKRNPFCGLQS